MFRGSFVAIVTPFSKDGRKIDYGLFRELLQWHLQSGTDGIVPAGCTGEAATLSHEEQVRLIEFTVKTVSGRAKVVAGTGSNCTAEALHLTQAARKVGADAAMLITPYYNKPTPEGQYRHYRLLAEKGGLPLMLYNVPSRTGINMLPETVARLHREVENVMAIKEAGGSVDQVSAIKRLCDIAVMSGDDSLTLPMMAVGASGVVSVLANLLPAEVKAMVDAAARGDFNRARQLHYQMLPLMKAMFLETNPICIKTALRLVGRGNGVLRMPLCEMQPKTLASLKDALREYGLKIKG